MELETGRKMRVEYISQTQWEKILFVVQGEHILDFAFCIESTFIDRFHLFDTEAQLPRSRIKEFRYSAKGMKNETWEAIGDKRWTHV